MVLLSLLEILALATATLLACGKYGTRNMAPLAALPLAAALIGIIDFEAALPIAMAPPVGLIAAIQLERGRAYGELIAAASIPGLVLGLFMLANIDHWVESPEQLTLAMSQLEESGTPEEIAAIQTLWSTMVRLLPGFTFVSVLLMAVLSYGAGHFFSERVAMFTAMPPPPLVRTWRLWDPLIWVLIAGTGLWFLGSGMLEDLGLNAVTVMLVLYAAQGFSVARYTVWRLGITGFLELLFYGALLFSGVALPLLAGVGLMDTWFDWRRLAHRAEAGGDSQ